MTFFESSGALYSANACWWVGVGGGGGGGGGEGGGGSNALTVLVTLINISIYNNGHASIKEWQSPFQKL